MVVVMSKEHQQYVSSLEKELESIYAVARKAREKGLDPTFSPEPEVAKDLPALVEGLVGPKGVAERIRALSEKMPREEIAFKIAEDTIYGKFGHMDAGGASEQAIRTALAILTEGITAAPIQGVAQVSIKTNSDRTKYLAVYFAGPIRSAGGTEAALTLVVADFVRRLLGLDRYKPTEDEIGRFIEEMRVYEREVGRFQYHVSDEELKSALQYLPVEVTGTQSNPVEVPSFRNLPRIETNRVRGGALRVVNDGIIGRSAKVLTVVEKLGLEGWDWLKNIHEIKQKKTAGFMEDIIAGRPIFSFPSRRGGFRLRYGRARNTGLSAVGVHPATMKVLHSFLAVGTQMRIEGPGKAGIVVPVDTIEPPIVRLKDGTVLRVTLENFEQVKNTIDRILFLGDILIGFGDFLYNNKPLPSSGITEEWWQEELQKSIRQKFGDDLEKAAATARIPSNRLQSFLENPFESRPNAEEAIALASAFQVPLHPYFTYFWSAVSSDEFSALRKWVLQSQVKSEGESVHAVTGAMDDSIKMILEKLCIPHKIVNNEIRIEDDEAHVFAYCMGAQAPNKRISHDEPVLSVIQELSGILVKEKAPTLFGARMGRPEKAKRREMKPLVHALFPIGLAGGSHRNIVAASNQGALDVDLVKRVCPKCKESTLLVKCPQCGGETVLERFCPQCGRTAKEGVCPVCRVPVISHGRQQVNLKEMLKKAHNKLNYAAETVKGVKSLMNETKTPEILEKGILRAKHDLSVYKDGTIRFDATNAPLTHFKPAEIGVSVEKLRELGYAYDLDGKPLTDDDQLCELKVQDVLIPRNGAEYFVHVADFLDELLEKVYDLPAYYKVKNVEDLIGRIIFGLAPHTSVGILGRIVGFTTSNVCYAHPLWHSAKRRDCDGDEDALMLALDPLLNFSKTYLPAQIGGIMDAPILLIPVINPQEVQRQAHEIDVARQYPLVFYEKTGQGTSSREVCNLIDIVAHRLNTEAQFEGFGYTVPVLNLNAGNTESTYKKLGKMTDKLNSQLDLAEKIEAVDAKRVAWKVLNTHFLRDIAGNLRAFTTQAFRCKKCNKRFRRLPLKGRCIDCGGALTLTVYKGGIEKYLEAAHQLVQKYGLPKHYAQRLSMIEDEINSLFEGGKSRQISLTDFAR